MIKLTTALTLGILLILITGSAGLAGSPPLPASFYGTVKLDGVNVPAGTLVSAWINGAKYAEAATTLADGTSVYLFDVPGDDPDTSEIEGGRDGEIVVFEVAGYDVDQTTRWFNGTHSRLDLTATTGPDLVVTAINLNAVTTDPQTLIAGGTGKATIRNQGRADVPADTTFAVTFFEDRDGDGDYDPATDNTLGEATYTGGLAYGAEAEVQALVTGEMRFRDNLIYAFVDSKNVVRERNELNNLNHSGNRCEFWPPVGQFNPVLEWEWTGGTLFPGFAEVDMTPVVIDLTADGIPDVVFITYDHRNPVDERYLVALNGKDGSEIFTARDPAHLTGTDFLTTRGIAVGDIDLDGRPEVLAVSYGGGASNYVLAFEHDGTFKWRTEDLGFYPGSVTLADLDRDGIPEIIVGGTAALNNDGTVRWINTLAPYGGYGGAIGSVLVANLDLEGDPEVVAGNAAFRSDGSVYWHWNDSDNDVHFDGFNAIANLDDDPFPEVVLFTNESAHDQGLYLFEHDGTLKWGPVATGPDRPGNESSPAIADVDGDGKPEIVVVQADLFWTSVFEADGSRKWSFRHSSYHGQPPSVFDFDGDGAAEIVHFDNRYLYILRGADGTVLWQTPRVGSLVIGGQYPVVADVDADGNAEIIVPGGFYPGLSPTPGIRVYGDANDAWVPTRQIWNQHSYHINNINDDGTIPAEETNSWEDHNTYRSNLQHNLHRAPDLSASRLLFDTTGLPDTLRITARIGNGGSLQVGNVPVAFYDGNPLTGGTLLGTVKTTKILKPDEYEDVTFTWSLPPAGAHDIYVVADDGGAGAGTQNECDETNNTHHQTVDTDIIGPDLVVPVLDPSGTTTDPQALTIVGDVTVQIKNQGNRDVTEPFEITLFEDTDQDGIFTDGADNVLGQRTYFGRLATGQSVWLPIAVSGNVLFRDNLIYVFADSQDVVAELDEDNNLKNSDARCQYLPPEGQFQPVLEWEWSGSTVLPAYDQVTMAPVVTDLTADGIPDVIFASYTGRPHGGYPNCHLRAINGNDGSEIFTVTDPNYDIYGASSIAVGDIDLDGRPEILAVDESGLRIIAFEHDGAFKWRSPQIPSGYIGIYGGGAAIADLDQDGTPEIVVGATVLNNDGTVRWTGADGRGDNADFGPLSLVANLDLAGDPEVIAGNTAYRSDGSIYWHNDSLTDGYNAVANFDDDPYPEIVLVTHQKVYLLEHDGTLKWGPAFLPGRDIANLGGPPTIADMDGDGEPEIGVAGGYAYAVFETDGTLKWSSETKDRSSSRTGSSVFDFEGDGSAEVIYGDELKLRIYRGTDGTILWETPSPSGTGLELPLIVDVDGDGNAEIVKITNNYFTAGSTGIQVYGDANDNWISTRQIWNQHTYHITNVNDDGTIPQFETNNWEVYNNYRLNTQARRVVYAAPDLTASYIRVDVNAYPASVTFTARVGNGGATNVPAGPPVAFYDRDPNDGGTLLGTVQTTQSLNPGEYEDMTFTWTTPGLGLQTVYVVADDDGAGTGTQNECDETNNTHWYQYITGPAGPDLTVPLLDGSGAGTDPRTLALDGPVSAQIVNQGSTAAVGDFDVTFFEDVDGDSAYTPGSDNVLGQTTYSGGLAPGATISVTASISGSVRFVGSPLWAFADSGDAIPELDETNNLNQTATQCQVNAAPAPDLTLSHLMAEPADLRQGDKETRGQGDKEIRGQGDREALDMSEGFQTADLLVSPSPPPPLSSSPPLLVSPSPYPLDLTVRVANAGEAPVAPGVPVSFYLGDPAAGGALLGNTATARTLAPGDFEDVTIRWTNETTGTHTIFVTVDAAGECDEANSTYQQRVDILDIPLYESWNLISGWVNPFYTDVGVVQRPISGTYAVIQGFDGQAQSYYPDLPAQVNTLKSIDAEHGYWIKVKPTGIQGNSGELGGTRGNSGELGGTHENSGGLWGAQRISPEFLRIPTSSSEPPRASLRIVGTGWAENHALPLDAGWNLVSFLSQNEMGVMEGLRSIDGEYTAALGFDQGALSYYPHLEPYFNTLWALQPLHGYWLKMTHASTLRYPRTQPDTVGVADLAGADPDARRRALLARQAERATGVQTTNTWVNFYGPARLSDGKPAPAGALIQVFDADGVACGAGIVTKPGLYGLLACYGDDPTTPADEGASPGDVLTFAIDGAPAPASAKAIWTVHGALQWAPLGPAPVWRVWLPVVGIGDLSRSRD
jgi:hypothetical protein